MMVHHIDHASNDIADRLAKQGRELGMDSTLFTMAPVDIACFIEKEQRDSSPVTALPLTIEQEMTFDPGGSMRVF
ncbi:hypothetical protein V6N12_007675 [Hibiscus sabdariffa]|uniref:RNase H type-1 domain-containing protein n=1 Tax=Hibiscus sabdariffa TaxID=183260 RepID=A0ABR2F2I9_9ROSI